MTVAFLLLIVKGCAEAETTHSRELLFQEQRLSYILLAMEIQRNNIKEFISIEYPARVENIDKMIETLGIFISASNHVDFF